MEEEQGLNKRKGEKKVIEEIQEELPSALGSKEQIS